MKYHAGRYDSRKNAESYAESLRRDRYLGGEAKVRIEKKEVYDVIIETPGGGDPCA